MGAWGFNILENDSSADAYADYVDHMNAGLSPKQAMEKIKADFADVLEDDEDAAYVWLGVAKAQWEYGHVDAKMIKRIEAIATSDAHLSEWDDSGGREKRRRVVEGFAAKLRSINPKPKKPRKALLRQQIYAPGTCLSVARDDGRYLAVLVLFNVIENPGPGQDTFGISTLALLNYLEPKPPTLDVFERRDFVREEIHDPLKPWLPCVRKGFANFHKRAKGKLSVVGTVKLTKADAMVPASLDFWDIPDGPEIIEKWRANSKRKDLRLAQNMEDLPEFRKRMKEMDQILRKHNPNRPPRKTIAEEIDLSPLKKDS